jgi:hypothetical protein
VQCRIGGYFGIDVFVQNGQVTVNSTSEYQRDEVNQWLAQVQSLLSQAADRLFAAQVQTALAGISPNMTTETVAVENAGVMQQATVFTLHI